mgnify:CR=1 FL=1
MFTKPVDTEEVPDYNMIIKQPMDLETMMTKIDMHCYLCARDFLDDIDLICKNALEYNPDRSVITEYNICLIKFLIKSIHNYYYY